MNLAKDLAWQKIFRGRSTNLKIEKSGFFFAFSLLSPPILSHFLIPSERIKLQPKILILRGRSTDNELRVHCSLDRSRSSLLDQKGQNFRVRLEIKGKKNRRKKTIFFYLLSDLLILIFLVVILYAHRVSGNEIK